MKVKKKKKSSFFLYFFDTFKNGGFIAGEWEHSEKLIAGLT